jgi:hypothetical protein
MFREFGSSLFLLLYFLKNTSFIVSHGYLIVYILHFALSSY